MDAVGAAPAQAAGTTLTQTTAPARRPSPPEREPLRRNGRQARRAGTDGGVDVDRLTDMVQARLLRRLAIERERRGGR